MGNQDKKDRVEQIEADVQRLLRELAELKANEAEKDVEQEQKQEEVEELLAEKAVVEKTVQAEEKTAEIYSQSTEQEGPAETTDNEQVDNKEQSAPETPEQTKVSEHREEPVREEKKKSLWQELKEVLFDKAGDAAREKRMGGPIEIPSKEKVQEEETSKILAGEQQQEKPMSTPEELVTLPKSPEPKQEDTTRQLEKQVPEMKVQSDLSYEESRQRRSLEEKFKFLLPKVFMVIFILGILWGLKLASDYGYLTDHLKVYGAFVLSIGLGAFAHHLDNRKKTLQVFLVTMYGGAFVIGILATAAGAILYEILPLMLALIIVIIYIIYGIYISYIKANEALTGFVFLTSFLLPYLFEYMKFDMFVILAYTVILFLVMQIVILKHQQQFVLYLGFLLSIFAIYSMWTMQEMLIIYPVVSFLIVNGAFLVSWMDLHAHSRQKWYHFQLAGLFTLSMFGLYLFSLMVTYLSGGSICLLALFVLYAAATFVLYQRRLLQAVEMNATITFIIGIATIFAMDEWVDYRKIFLALIFFAGMILGIRLRSQAMKLLNGLLLTLMMVNLQEAAEVRPFLSVDHIALLVTLIAMISSYIFAKRQKKVQLKPFEKIMKQYYFMEVILSGIILFTFMYLIKLDFAYLSIDSQIAYFAYIAIAFSAVLSLTIEPKYIGKVAPLVLIIVSVSASLSLGTGPAYAYTEYVFFRILTSLAFIGSVLAVLLDLFYSGKIYDNYKNYVKKHIEYYFIGGLLLLMYYSINLATYLTGVNVVSAGVHTIWLTITIFITASLALIIDALKDWRKLKIFGYVMLGVAIFKLIFVDLAILDLFIRAILFIIIGGVGMFLSAKLLKNEKEE